MRYWPEISYEGKRMLTLMTGAEPSYAADSIISGVAAQAAHGVVAAFAEMLRLDFRFTELAIYSWIEGNVRKGPVTLEEFVKIGEQEAKEIADLLIEKYA